ncbi:NDR1/HIN1-like protein [Dyadobacter psychrophilus]|uniref:Late embryogenesis abundant protein n=1 Tax=Dyadobacter psychrophilus TaxID=651661 RepID=A0A1T5GLV5_9BACT|nr:LEA type 2 family protein [Dyadobacter psychrophilus]SKC09348.1 Late embryogenesis abundant protein [Dyadobacter psychrophilus]
MRFNKWYIISLLILLLAGAGIWWWKSPSSDQAKEKAADKVMPTIGVASAKITDIDAERIKLVSQVTLYNPLPVDIKTSRLNYIIYIDSVKVIEDAYEKPISIQSSDSSTITLPMQVLAKPLAQILTYFEDKKIDSADYSMKASFEVDVPIAGDRKFNMDISRRLPALRFPKVKVRHVDLNALKLKSKGMDVEVEIFNPNLFPLKLSDAKFHFSVENALEMDGVLEKVIRIPAKGTQNVSMHALMTDGNMLKTGWKMLTDKKDTQFAGKFTGNIDSENKMLSGSKMNATITGTLDEIVNTVKKVD